MQTTNVSNIIEKTKNFTENFKENFKELCNKIVYHDDDGKPFPKSHLDQFNATLGIYPLSHFLPHRSYDPNLGFYLTQHGRSLLWKATPLVGVDSSVAINLHQILQVVLPIGTCGQILLHASNKIGDFIDAYEREREAAKPIFRKIAKYRARHCKQAALTSAIDGPFPFLLRDYHLYLSFSFDYKLMLEEKRLLQIKQQLLGMLKVLDLEATEVMPDEFLALTHELLHPEDSVYQTKCVWDPKESLNRQMVNSNFLRKLTSKRVATPNNDWEMINFSVKEYPEPAPRLWDMAQAIGGIFNNNRIACPFYLSIIFKICDPKDEIQAGEGKSSIAETRARERGGKSKEALEDVYIWRDILANKEAGERILISNFQIQLYAKSEEMANHETMTTSIFNSKMRWKIERNDLLHMPAMLAHIPMSQTAGLFQDLSELGLTKKLWSMNVASVAPVIAEMKGMRSKKMLVVGRRGQIWCWDPFSNTKGNYNASIIGGSGAGKSVWMQEMVSSQLSTGGRVWVVDVGRSYFKLNTLMGGDFVVFSRETPLCLNPFTVANPKTIDSFKIFMRSLIYMMAFPSDLDNDPNRGWNMSTISIAIESVWNAAVASGRRPDLQDVIDFLAQHSDARARDLAVQLYAFGRAGPYGHYFNGEGKLDFEGDFIVFELEEISQDKHLQSLIFMLLMHYVTEKMYLSDRSRRMSLLIDEAWDMLKGGYGALVIESIARRARKYQGNLVTGTQSVMDYNASPAAKAAWDNSYWQVMLSQDKGSIGLAIKNGMLNLEPFEEKLMRDVHTEHGAYSEVLLRGKSGEYAVGRFILDPFSNALYSTQPGEFAAFNSLKQQGLSTEDALEQIAISNYGLVI
jgi:conjugal transfer ATP-binding protein TraC